MPSCAIMSCFWSHSNSSSKSFCSVQATHLRGAWYGLLPGLNCKEDIPLKQPIPLNTSLNCFCTSVLFQHLTSYHFLGWDPEGNSLVC